MPAEVEETGVDALDRAIEDRRPELLQVALGLAQRCHLQWSGGVFVAQAAQFGAVDLAVLVDRHGVEQENPRRQEMPWQPLAQRVHHLAFAQVRGLGHHEGRKRPVAALGRLVEIHGRAADAGKADQHGLDLGQLDPDAAQLDLAVASPQAIEAAIGAQAADIAGPVELPVRAAGDGVGQECPGGQVGALPIAQRKQVAAQHQLARDAGRQQAHPLVDHIDGGGLQRRADRNRGCIWPADRAAAGRPWRSPRPRSGRSR